MSAKKKLSRVVTIGGGTGTFGVIAALKKLPVDISSIVAVSDSGGSTGRIRDEFGFQPVGDLRQSLAALADPKEQEWIQKILLYRFEKGEGLKGHNLGNLILTALQDMSSDTTQALQIAEKVFDLKGSVIPVTQEVVQLQIHYTDGTVQVGEHLLNPGDLNPKAIDHIELLPPSSLNPTAAQALLAADFIIVGPGDYFASLMAALVVKNLKKVLSQSPAEIMYVGNLMTRRTQTHGMTMQDHLKGIEAMLGKKVDHVLINNEHIPKEILTHYASEEEYPVNDDLSQKDNRVIRAPLLGTVTVAENSQDTIHRSLLRHDPEKICAVLTKLI